MKAALITRLVFLRLLIITLILSAGALLAQDAKPKYVFLMIGDGMGVSQVEIADKYRQLACTDDPKLVFNSFPVKGRATTNPIPEDKTTDSAASGTALACGVKTKNGMIGMTPGEKPQKSVAAVAKECGKKVAVISSVGVNHATPACFYAHQGSRGSYDDISAQIAESGFDFFAGEPLMGKKGEKVREAVRAAGYKTICQSAGIMNFSADGKVLIEHEIPYRADLKDDSVRLVDFVNAGLKAVGNAEKGFFMMVEGGKIDWAGHANDFGSVVGETLEFGEAVKAVYQFYKTHPDETLIVVTADHETGDFKFDAANPARLVEVVNGQVCSSGVLDERIKGWKKEGLGAGDIAARCLTACGVGDATPDEIAGITKIAEAVLSGNKDDDQAKELKKMYGNKNALIIACQRLAAERSGASFSSFGHTPARVPVAAIGPGSEQFAGDTDNAEIGRKLIELVK